jgi:hypothetical protein
MLSTKMPKILIVGSGLTGSLVAAQIAKENISSQLQLSIWEKARGAGKLKLYCYYHNITENCVCTN